MVINNPKFSVAFQQQRIFFSFPFRVLTLALLHVSSSRAIWLKEQLLHRTHGTVAGERKEMPHHNGPQCLPETSQTWHPGFLSLHWPKPVTWLSTTPMGPRGRLLPQRSTVNCMAIHRHVLTFKRCSKISTITQYSTIIVFSAFSNQQVQVSVFVSNKHTDT